MASVLLPRRYGTTNWADIRFAACDFTAAELRSALGLAEKAREGDQDTIKRVIRIIIKGLMDETPGRLQMVLAKIATHGQSTLPLEIRKKLKVGVGGKVVFYEENWRIAVENAAKRAFAALLQGRGQVWR